MCATRRKSYDHLYKVVLIGDAFVGKTALMDRYAHKRFGDWYEITIGVAFAARVIQYANRTVKLQIVRPQDGNARATA